MQLTKDLKCSACGAVVNPNWKACIVCDHPLDNHKPLDLNDPESLFKLLRMPLSEFKRGGYLVRVRCRHLGDQEVFIASSEKEAETGRAEGLVTFTADEMIQLIKSKATPEEVQALHKVKKTFQTELQEVNEIKPAVSRGA